MTPWPGRTVALLVAAAFFMEALDGTIIATAAPRMASSFGTTPVAVNVVMTAYLITLAVGIPASGWIATRFGARRVFCAAIVVFTLASGLCAACTTLPALTATRVLQGLGGALMVPVGRLVVLRGTERGRLFTAIAYLTWPALLAPVVAPVLGGVFATYLSWRWIFLVNLPIGVVLFAVARRLVPVAERLVESGPLDWTGFALTGVGLTAGVLGMEDLGGGGLLVPLCELALAGALLTASLAHMRRSPHPLLALRTLRITTYRAVVLGGSLYRTTVSAAPFLLPLMFQEGFGWSPLRAGATVIAVFVGNVGIKPFTTPLMRRLGFRPVLLGSTAGLAATFAGCAALSAGGPPAVTYAVLLAGGVFRSTGYTAYNTLQFADVPAERMAGANTLASTGAQLAGGLGVAVGALVLRIAASAHPGGGAVAPYRIAFTVLAALALLSAVQAVRLAPDAGAAARPAAA